MPVLATALLLTSWPQERSWPTATLFCEESMKLQTPGFSTFARIEVDKDHKLIDAMLSSRTPDLTAIWTVWHVNGVTSLSTRSLQVGSWPLPRDTRFPIKVQLLMDGATSSTHAYSKPNVHYIVPGEPSAGSTRASRRPELVSSPAIAMPKSLRPANLLDATQIEVVVDDHTGVRVTRKSLRLPDWKALAAFTETSFVKLEARRKRGECKPHFINVVS
jgi:hypothetical protein